MSLIDFPARAFNLAFGRIIAARRERLRPRVPQERFAFETGVDRSNYGKLERGEHTPSFERAWRIARRLRIPLSRLIAAVEKEMGI